MKFSTLDVEIVEKCEVVIAVLAFSECRKRLLIFSFLNRKVEARGDF